jgi:hypothetical protein
MKKPRDGSNTRSVAFLPDVNWTLEQAQEEQARAEAEGKTGPRTPFFQWVALNEVERLRLQFEMGSDFALLQAVAECALHGLVMPPWLSQNYLERYRKVVHADVGTWDEAFGRPYPKGKHLESLQQRRDLRLAVYNEIRARLASAEAPAKDDLFYEEVGAKFKIGKTLCKDLYREVSQGFSGPPTTFAQSVIGEVLKPFVVKRNDPAAKSDD